MSAVLGGDDGGLRARIAELERELREERDRYSVLASQAEVDRFVARQEAERRRRDCAGLEDRVARLEQDCGVMRERVRKDQEKIKGLLEEMEAKEREFKEKFIELKVEGRDLECGRRRARDEAEEWRRRCEEMEAERARLARGAEGSSARPVDEVDEELPERAEEAVVVTPEQQRTRTLVEDDAESLGGEDMTVSDDGDSHGDDYEKDDVEIPIQRFRKKRCAEEADGASKANDSKRVRGRPRGRRGVSGKDALSLFPGEAGKDLVGEAAAAATKAQVPVMPENGTQEDMELEISRNPQCLVGISANKCNLLTGCRSPRKKKKFTPFSLRHSSARTTLATSDAEVATDPGLWALDKRNSGTQRKKEYTGRIPTSEQKQHALAKAEELQKNLDSKNPSFVRSLTRSNVSTCFWLGFPPKFCEENHLPAYEIKVAVEDEKGFQHKMNYIGSRGGVCGGWKGFATDNNLEIGDALVFELIEPLKFKVYIIKAIQELAENSEPKIAGDDANSVPKVAEDDTNSESMFAAEGTNGILKQSSSGRVRRVPLRFRLVRRNPEGQSKVEGHQE